MSTRITDDRECLTVEMVAIDLCTTPLRILMLIREKALTGELRDGAWRVTRESLERFKSLGADLSLQASCRSSCNSSVCGCK